MLNFCCTPDLSGQAASLDMKQLQGLFDASPRAVLVADANGVIRYANSACCEAMGYPVQQLVGQHADLLRCELTPEPVYHSLNRALAQRGRWSGEVCTRRYDGKPSWQRVQASVFNGPGGQPHVLILMDDLVTRLEYEQWLFPKTGFDALTGLPSRVQVYELLCQQIEQCAGTAQVIGLLSIDIYRFKQFNESLGHSAADELLKAVAGRLQRALNSGDHLCRLGGDQFLLLAANLDSKQTATDLALLIRDHFSASFMIEGQHIFVGLSIGVAVFPDDSCDPVALLKHADTALYQAKKQGRDRISVFLPEMEQQARQNQQLESELRFALERGELEVYYQPLIDLDGKTQGAEAVMRWKSPGLGNVSPEQFVALAESIGMIHKIGDWCLDQACAQVRRWLDRSCMPTFVAVNVSPRQLCHAGFVDHVTATLAKHQLSPEHLELEVTEGVLMDNKQQASSHLHQLSCAGIRLSIDDFGTGYSSLSYLQHLPFNTLKIDRSFVDGIPTNRSNAKLVKAIVAMAQSLGMQLVAEGVEHSEQVTFLQALGCDLLQGYYFSPPMSAAAFLEWLAD